MSKTLRYKISNWSQITDCLSNNSRNLYLSLNKIIDGNRLKGQLLQVNHASYGTLFAAMIIGSGQLITETDDEGNIIPFLTTKEILKQIQKFGFIVEYDVKSNLPSPTIALLSTLYELKYDKITVVQVRIRSTESSSYIWKPQTIVMKSEFNTDIINYRCKITEKLFKDKLAKNTIMNVSNEEGINWDWVTYTANISDILDENIDPVDEYETDTGVEGGFIPPVPEGFTPYVDEDSEDAVQEDELTGLQGDNNDAE